MDSIVVGRCSVFCWFCFCYIFFRPHIIHSFHSLLCVSNFSVFANICFGRARYAFQMIPKGISEFLHTVYFCVLACAESLIRAPEHAHFYYMAPAKWIRFRPPHTHTIFYFVRSHYVDRLLAFDGPFICVHLYFCPYYLMAQHVCVCACASARARDVYSVLVFCGSALKFSPRFRF